MAISRREKAKQSNGMNLIERLKDMPKGTKLYSPMFGDVFLLFTSEDFISVYSGNPNYTYRFNKEGKYSEHGECMLFPSRENRDWNTFNKFDINSIKPFDKVLVRDDDKSEWYCDFYSHYRNNESYYKYACISSIFYQCIPYNDDTKHLVGTKENCSDYYKTW